MNHLEIVADRLLFDAADPYQRYAYLQVLDLLVQADEDDPGLSRRVRDQEERSKQLLGDRRVALITAQAALDAADISNPVANLLGQY